jgi:hypothetical protein
MNRNPVSLETLSVVTKKREHAMKNNEVWWYGKEGERDRQREKERERYDPNMID